jgi:DNA-binding CsgD family transcriptional regulator
MDGQYCHELIDFDRREFWKGLFMSLDHGLLRTIEALNAAPLQKEGWTLALEQIADVMDAGHAILLTQPDEPVKSPFCAAARLDEHDLARSAFAAQHCDAGALESDVLPTGSVVWRTAVINDSDYERDTHYNEVVRPLNGFYGLFVQQRVADTRFFVNVCRPRQAADFESVQMSLLEQLLPHLRTSIALAQRIGEADAKAGGLGQAFGRSRDAVILLDGKGRCCFANARASSIAGENDGLVLDEAGVAAAVWSETLRLRGAIAAAAADATAEIVNLLLTRPSQRPPLIASVMPVRRFDVAITGASAPHVAVFIREMDAPPQVDLRLLADIFRLTRRESEIAAQLAAGRNLDDIAAALQLGGGTVRYHIKNVFEKTGMRNQAALVALIRGMADL